MTTVSIEMKIQETIDRECCQARDMKIYKGLAHDIAGRFNPKFCVHCGQIWVVGKEMGPAGSMDSVLIPVVINRKFLE